MRVALASNPGLASKAGGKMELVPTLIIVTLGAVFALAGLIAGFERAPGGAHAADRP
jgi:hypothetical protein